MLDGGMYVQCLNTSQNNQQHQVQLLGLVKTKQPHLFVYFSFRSSPSPQGLTGHSHFQMLWILSVSESPQTLPWMELLPWWFSKYGWKVFLEESSKKSIFTNWIELHQKYQQCLWPVKWLWKIYIFIFQILYSVKI